jgi:hypothetical protein
MINHKKYTIILFLLSSAAIIFYFLFILPHSGIDFADTGLTLYSSLSLIDSHVSYDWIGLPRPCVLNAFFMWVGIKNILFLKIAFSLTFIFSCGLLLLSINKSFISFLPIIATLGIYSQNTAVGSYENSPSLFLAFAIAFFFLSDNINKYISYIFLTLSSFFFALSVFTNISVLPAGLFSVILLCILNQKKSIIWFISSFLGFLLAMIYYYVLIIGSDPFHLLFVAHASTSTITKFLLKSFHIGFLVLKIIFCCIVIICLIKFFFRKKIKYIEQYGADYSIALLLLFGLIFVLHEHFSIYLFSSTTFWLPIIALFTLVAAFCGIAIYPDFNDKRYNKILVVFILGLAYFSCQAVVTDNPILLPLSYYCALFCIVFLAQLKKIDFISSAVISLLLLASVYTQLNFSYGNGKTFYNTAELHLPKLEYIYVHPLKKELVNKLYQLYIGQHCSTKPFVAFYDLPILYYLFDRKAPLYQSWISNIEDSNGFPIKIATDEKILDWLRESHQWCVYYSSGLINKLPDPALIEYLQTNSLKIYVVNYSGVVGNIWLDSAPSHYKIFVK